MALKTLMLRLKIDGKRKELEAEQRTAESLAAKSAEIEQRTADIETAINEVENDEQRAAVEQTIAELEAENNDHVAEVNRNAEALATLSREVEELEAELKAAESAQEVPAAVEPEERTAETKKETRKGYNMITRYRDFSAQQRTEFVERDDNNKFIGEIRTALKEKRGIQGIAYSLPVDWVGLIRAELPEFSLLYKHLNVKQVNGNGRGAVLGVPGEAVWTELCGNINEMELSMYQVLLSLHKLGIYVALCNAAMYMSDEDLAAEIIRAIAQGMAYAYDKAVIFGDGATMPYGIATTLVEQSQPANYPATARPWADLHTSNVFTIANSVHGADFFKALVQDIGAASPKYGRGGKFFIMNEKTKNFIMSESIAFNAAGALVAGMNNEMPVIGGAIEVAEFMPDYMICGGYGMSYTLGEGRGFDISMSEHAHFIEDETIFKGITYADGRPVIREAFVFIGVNGTTPAVSGVSFKADDANTVQGIYLNTSTASVAVGSKIQLKAFTFPVDGAVEWTSATTAKATVNSSTGEVTGVATGSSVVTATCNGYTASCTVTVTA